MRLWPLAALLCCACGGGPPEPTEPPSSETPRCTDETDHVSCIHQGVSVNTVHHGQREVHWQLPQGDAPDGGFPVVVYYQGSFQVAVTSWDSKSGDNFGKYRLTQTIEALLNDGYTVLTPDTDYSGNYYWDTNLLPYTNNNWEGSPDDEVVVAMLAELEKGTFGPVNLARLYAMGISSGGFMTSRMAVSYGGKFRALAIGSASYATCSVSCSVPNPLPADHPPTLFLHGEKDNIVPIGTMWPYQKQLDSQGISNSTEIDANAGHQWLDAAVTRVPAWFDANP